MDDKSMARYAEVVRLERPQREHYYRTSARLGAAKGRYYAVPGDTLNELHREALEMDRQRSA